MVSFVLRNGASCSSQIARRAGEGRSDAPHASRVRAARNACAHLALAQLRWHMLCIQAAPWHVDSHLVLTSLVKRYGDTVAVDGIDLTIPAGSYCCLLGPSGCGKTSTLRMIAGHEEPTSGDDPARRQVHHPPAAGGDRGTAMMFQSYALFPHLTVLDNVAFSCEDAGRAPGRAPRTRQGAAAARRDDAVLRTPAQRALGRPAAARGAGPRADDRAARAAARRAAVGARPLPARADARRAASAGSRSWASPSCTSRTRRKRRWRWPTRWW